MPLPLIDPPLLNSANPWATSTADLQALFDCPHTGAITTRTSLVHGFEHDDAIHQYTFFDPETRTQREGAAAGGGPAVSDAYGGSLNTLGYSPITLATYLSMIKRVVDDSALPEYVKAKKPIIVSVTGSVDAVVECFRRVQAVQATMTNPLCVEVNLSCPNIPDKPPPAYSGSSLLEYLHALAEEALSVVAEERVPIGVKTPPYTYHDQFRTLIDALLAASKPQCPISFITATNTLGSSLVLADTDGSPALGSASGMGIGGMAGTPLHPLALGNVRTLRAMLDKHDELRAIDVIGVGGVSDRAGFQRMQAVGAKVVGVGTALGRLGVDVFEHILHPSADGAAIVS